MEYLEACKQSDCIKILHIHVLFITLYSEYITLVYLPLGFMYLPHNTQTDPWALQDDIPIYN